MDGGETRDVPELAETITQVLREIAQPTDCQGISALLPCLFHTAQRDKRLSPGFLATHALT